MNLWAAYENIIFRFGYGEYLNERKLISLIATPVAKKYIKNQDDIINNIFEKKFRDKCSAVSFCHVTGFKK